MGRHLLRPLAVLGAAALLGAGLAGPVPAAAQEAPSLPAPEGGLLTPVTPARLLDTREAGGAVVAGSPRELDVTGVGGVPETGVAAVVLNVTVTGGSQRSDLQVHPVGQRPLQRTSNVNWLAGQTVPVQVQTAVGRDGRIALSVAGGRAHVVVDVFGWYASAGSAGSAFRALVPERVLDTRESGSLVAGTPREVRLAGRAGVPEDATAVLLNATALGATTPVDVAVLPTGDRPQRRTSNLNLRPGETVANAVLAPLSPDGRASLSASAGSVEVVLDVLGAFVPGTGGRFVALSPNRLLDTRRTGGPVAAGTPRQVQVAGRLGVPEGADAVALGVVGTAASAPLDLQVRPAGEASAERTSTLNLLPGQAVPNLAPVRLGTGGKVALSVSQGSAFAVLDVFGYWTSAASSVCTNPQDGWTARYPAHWRANPGTVIAPCSAFDPEPVVLEPATEIPLSLAVLLRREDVPVQTALGDGTRRVEDRRESTVDGREAFRLELVQTEGTIIPQGTRYTQWLVDLGSQTLIASAFDLGSDPSYGTKVQVLDAVMATLDLGEQTGSRGLPPFAVSGAVLEQEPSGEPRLSVADVRTGRHEGYDRVVLDLEGSGGPGWRAAYEQDVREPGRGRPVELQGSASLQLLVRGVALPGDTSGSSYDGPVEFDTPGLQVVREVHAGGPFEGHYQVVLGVDEERPFRVFALSAPARLVVDVAAR